MRIGFIGLGNMGSRMAENLASAGHEVSGFDIAAPAPKGVELAASTPDAARDKDVVITMLPDGESSRSVSAKAIPIMKQYSVLLDCSTIDIESALHVGRLAMDNNLLFVDAPVSGGIGGARDGTLTFMVGGSPDALKTVTPLLDIMGARTVHCGNVGSGQAAKICNNMILGSTMIATCEAFALAERLSLDPQKLFEVVSTSSGFSWVSNVYCPVPGVGPKSPADNQYKAGFAAALMLKDLELSQMAAQSVGMNTVLGKTSTELYKEFVELEDKGELDFSAILLKFRDDC